MITILCSGSRGDFQPYIALAQELKKMGKDVRITASKSFEGFIQNYGIDIYPIEADFETLNVDPKLLEAAGSSDNPLKMLLTFNKMKEYGIHMVSDYYSACEGSELIIYHPGCSIGYFAAQKFGIPSVLASPFPINKTSEYLSVVMYGKAPSNPLTKSISYSLIQGMLWMASKDSVKGFWREKFGKLPDNFGCPFEKHNDAMHPAIVSCSNFVFKRPNDWDKNIHQYGYWFVEETSEYIPDTKLAEFLDKGEKPIYIGFGSMTSLGKYKGLAELAVDAINKTGKRGIICGMGTPPNITHNILSIDNVPHSWLFERVSVVCHHGGVGTTAAGFKAGVPSVIIPFSNDQFSWAHRAYDLGVATKPLPKKSLTSNDLANAIQYALSGDIVKNAKSLGSMIASENGANDCAKVIIESLQR